MTLWKRERNIYIETHICICIYVCIYHSYILGKCTYKCISPYIHMCLYITYTHVSPKVVQAQTLINWISKVTLLENLGERKPAWVRASSKGWRILKKKNLNKTISCVVRVLSPHSYSFSQTLSLPFFFAGGGWLVSGRFSSSYRCIKTLPPHRYDSSWLSTQTHLSKPNHLWGYQNNHVILKKC